MFVSKPQKGKPDALHSFNREIRAKVEKAIDPVTGGRIRYQASFWPAQSTNGLSIAEGETVIVIGREGLALIVQPYHERN